MKNGFGIITNDILYNDTLSDKAKLLYTTISGLCAAKGYCWATNDYLAKLYSTSTRTISRRITELSPYLEIEYINKGKTIERRKISLDKNVQPPRQNCPGVVDKNVQQNNTSNNNIINKENTKENIEEVYSFYVKNIEVEKKYHYPAASKVYIDQLLLHYTKNQLIEAAKLYFRETDRKWRKSPKYFYNNSKRSESYRIFEGFVKEDKAPLLDKIKTVDIGI